MLAYLLQRLAQAAVTVLLVSIAVFMLARVTGNPVDLLVGEHATPADREALVRAMGLDQPLIVQYGTFLGRAVAGDLGRSVLNNRSVSGLITETLPASLQLGSVALMLSLMLALPAGVLSAVRRGSRLDAVAKVFALLGQSLPTFLVGLIFMLVFAVWVPLFPPAGRGLSNVVLPAVTLGWFATAGIMRLVRSSMLEVLDSDYILMARAKGMTERLVVWKHAFKNASLPVVTYTMVMAVTVFIVGGTTVEIVFAWPGLGYLAYESIVARDYPVVQGIVLFAAAIFVFMNLLADILYAYIDPRIRY